MTAASPRKLDHLGERRQHRRKVLANFKNLIAKRIHMKMFQNKKSASLELAPELSVSNIYVSSRQLQADQQRSSLRAETRPRPRIRFKVDTSQCPRCYFGDQSLTCTCSFRAAAPDFKLYEDDDRFVTNFHTLHTLL